MNLFLDVEFNNQSRNSDPVSMAVVNENGNHFYAEFTDFDTQQISEWSRNNVFPSLKYVTNRDLENLLKQYNKGSLGIGIDYPNQMTSQYAHDNMNNYDGVIARIHKKYGIEPENDPTGEIKNRMNKHQLSDEHGLRSPNPAVQADLRNQYFRDCGCYGKKAQVSELFHQWLSQFLGENSGKLYFYTDSSPLDGMVLYEILNAGATQQMDVRRYVHPRVYDIASLMKERNYHPEQSREELAYGKKVNESRDLYNIVPESIRSFPTFQPNNALYDAYLEYKVYEAIYQSV